MGQIAGCIGYMVEESNDNIESLQHSYRQIQMMKWTMQTLETNLIAEEENTNTK